MERPELAVSVGRSVRPDHLVCLICAKRQKLLKHHLAVEHERTPNLYRDSFGLKPGYPMASPNNAQQPRELAVKIGLGNPKRARRRTKGADAPGGALRCS
jgi:predicted transcriptional regulator